MAIQDDPQGGVIYKMDTIEYINKFWLVPAWLESPYLAYKMPDRIICLENLPHQKSNLPETDFVLNNPIPKDVLDGKIIPELKDKYVVIIRPDIKISKQKFS